MSASVACRVETRPIRLQLVQINNNYGNQYYLPYSIGSLAACIMENERLADAVEFRPFIFKRDPVDEIVRAIGQVDVLGVSCYVWNWRLSLEVAKGVRACNPDVLIVFGGPQIPDHDADFFSKYPFVDVVAHGEGERTVQEILEHYLDGKSCQGIAGTSVQDRASGHVVRGPERPKMRDLTALPSPYLKGLFAPLMAQSKDYSWMVVWETNRGCPFTCAFCDWGSSTASKILEFAWDRVMGELDWFAENHIEFVMGADSNFGIRKRDIDIARALVKSKQERGYPRDYRVSFTKNSTDKIFDVATIFHQAQMLKGVSLSMQSLDDNTLDSIKRKNIHLDVFEQLQARYTQADIPTFTELIVALPGETYDSFASGIDTLLDRGQHSQIVIYNCTVMPNAEMGHPDYQRKYDIKTVQIPIFMAHSAIRTNEWDLVEYEDIITSTGTMSVEDWRRSHRFAWAIQCFHMMGMLQSVAIFLRHYCGISYRDFYEGLLAFGAHNPQSVMGQEMQVLDQVLDRVLAGIGFDQHMAEYGDIVWPPEEASFLRLSEIRRQFYEEITQHLSRMLADKAVEPAILADLMTYQQAIVVGADDQGDISISLSSDVPGYVVRGKIGDAGALERGQKTYVIPRGKGYGGDRVVFARECVWYGRKGGRFLYQTPKPLS